MDHIEKQKDLINKAKSGDSLAFEELYNSLYSPLFSFVLYKTKNKELSQDICQEVFISWYKSLDTYQFSIKLENYLFLIAMRLIINNSKKKKIEHLNELTEENLPDTKENIEDLLEKRYDFNIVKELITELSEDQQNVLILKYISDKDNSEIADILEKSKDNIRQLEHRGLAKLYNIYKEKYEK